MNSTLPRSTTRIAQFGLALFTVLISTSCFHRASQAPTAVRYDETTSAAVNTELEGMKGRYNTAMEAERFETARIERDRMIFLTRVEIDKWYAALEQKLHETRASFNSWTDFAELGLAGAAAIASPVDTKTIYATVLSVTKGTRLSIDKNWFREKATESLINAMRAGRNQQLAIIIKKMTGNSANRYTFEEAWGDLIAYHQAGTIQGGLVTLAAQTGDRAVKSEEEVNQANQARYAEVNDAMTADEAAENGTMRELVRKMSMDQRRKTLEQIDGQAPASSSDADVNSLITQKLTQLAMKQSVPDRQKIITAIKANAPTQ